MIISDIETSYLLCLICIIGLLLIKIAYKYNNEYEIYKSDFILLQMLFLCLIISIILILRN